MRTPSCMLWAGRLPTALACLFAVLSSSYVFAEEAEVVADDSGIVEEVVVTGDLRSLPGENVESIFGFQKSLLETPRSASTISWEQIERFNIKDIDELVALAPGTFTQSFFGVAGSLEVRGTPGETYFRGIRRLDNPGNYPTPIGAADRVDVVRGPASPIAGPAKIGGYLNFTPKSARADSGQYLEESEGAIGATIGTWDQNILTAEFGGPGRIGGKEFGYWIYGEVENSDSFYQNTETENTLIQASFDMDLTDQLRIQWGGMYHDFEGNQIAGWNRLTQELIDDGIYVTGSPISVDLNDDGFNSQSEFNDNPANFAPFFFGVNQNGANPQTTQELADALGLTATDLNALALQDPGTAQLRPSQVLVAPDDTLENEAIILYLDVIYQLENGWEIKNQLYYEQFDNLNENAYGFSQFADSSVVENKLVFSKVWESDTLKTSIQLSPSYRQTNFQHGDDFFNEHFNRRDLTGPSTAIDRRLLATRTGLEFSTFNDGDYKNYAAAALIDLDWEFGLNVTAGARWDVIEIDGFSPGRRTGGADISESDTVDGESWTFSVSYETPWGIRPYFTASEQGTLIVGQGAQIDTADIANGAFDTSELTEWGIKGSFLDDKLYFALSVYEQERTDVSAQSIVTNQTSQTEGTEFELRWAATEKLLLTLGWTDVEVLNLTTAQPLFPGGPGGRFSFVGAGDFPNVDPAAFFYGGTVGAIVFADGSDESISRAGVPENILTFTGTYQLTSNWAVHASIIDVDQVDSAFGRSIELPSYTLVNIGFAYENDNWFVGANLKNATDEEYFRSNFPNLFGSQIVLPELPRHFTATVQYSF